MCSVIFFCFSGLRRADRRKSHIIPTGFHLKNISLWRHFFLLLVVPRRHASYRNEFQCTPAVCSVAPRFRKCNGFGVSLRQPFFNFLRRLCRSVRLAPTSRQAIARRAHCCFPAQSALKSSIPFSKGTCQANSERY